MDVSEKNQRIIRQARKIEALDDERNTALDRAERAEALIASQARRVEELEKGLRPFGDVGDLLESETEGFTDSDEIRLVVGDLDVELERVRFEHFRRARALLNRGEG